MNMKILLKLQIKMQHSSLILAHPSINNILECQSTMVEQLQKEKIQTRFIQKFIKVVEQLKFDQSQHHIFAHNVVQQLFKLYIQMQQACNTYLEKNIMVQEIVTLKKNFAYLIIEYSKSSIFNHSITNIPQFIDDTQIFLEDNNNYMCTFVILFNLIYDVGDQAVEQLMYYNQLFQNHYQDIFNYMTLICKLSAFEYPSIQQFVIQLYNQIFINNQVQITISKLQNVNKSNVTYSLKTKQTQIIRSMINVLQQEGSIDIHLKNIQQTNTQLTINEIYYIQMIDLIANSFTIMINMSNVNDYNTTYGIKSQALFIFDKFLENCDINIFNNQLLLQLTEQVIIYAFKRIKQDFSNLNIKINNNDKIHKCIDSLFKLISYIIELYFDNYSVLILQLFYEQFNPISFLVGHVHYNYLECLVVLLQECQSKQLDLFQEQVSKMQQMGIRRMIIKINDNIDQTDSIAVIINTLLEYLN